MEGKRVFICSPYQPMSGDSSGRAQEVQRNIDKTRSACRMAKRRGYAPMAPQLYFPQFLNDRNPEERQSGIEMGLTWLGYCDELWVIGESVSKGMVSEIVKASEMGIPIRCIPTLSHGDERLLAAVKAQPVCQA